MKNNFQKVQITFALALCTLFFFNIVQAKSFLPNTSAKNEPTILINDSSLVLQQCLDLPMLQSYFPIQSATTYFPIYIMQVPVAFPAGMSVSKFQQNVFFESRPEIYNQKRQAFFNFKSFLISTDTAKVVFDYNYNYILSPVAIEVTLTLQKLGSNWTISNTVTTQR